MAYWYYLASEHSYNWKPEPKLCADCNWTSDKNESESVDISVDLSLTALVCDNKITRDMSVICYTKHNDI